VRRRRLYDQAADNRRLVLAGPGDGFAFPPAARHTGPVTGDRLELISTDPGGKHGRASVTVRVGAADDLRLLRCYEPVLRFTEGELFLPMPVEDYLEKCSLWQSGPKRGRGRSGAGERICAPGELTPGRLAQMSAPGSGLALRFVERPLGRRELRAWRRDAGRPRLAGGGGRFAAVGLLSRFIDSVMRVSLLLRGRVPGGTTAAAEQDYRAHAEPDSCPYYGRVSRDRGFIALQYWFLYAMNDWRSTFAGVNDHEADWEQVTVFLPDPPDTSQRPAWVAFSSHDETGDDLRRRFDDPDLSWRDTHPVVFVGAGSHSGACLPGDYLVTVEPPSLRRMLAWLRRLSRLLLPWTRTDGGTALGLPFIDYHRGDGPSVGPGEAKRWCPVLIDDQTPWVRDDQGLWDWTPATRSAGSARRPARVTSAMGRCGSAGLTRWDGQASIRRRRLIPQSSKPSRAGSPRCTLSSPPSQRNSMTAATNCAVPASASGH
jgi:hypothetical protein